ncbi:tRNA (adenosine(37)-N6)-threonylcarbamoyltransferase complex ATPase subunit type 1 TsaE [Patescibacteria group bacterium]|nr:tRNA (adenosine(37)-N6)-threonylcarbamoyltransferase complex ATPase subunit type 1 TsaE [Patescibacteria group bacterium]
MKKEYITSSIKETQKIAEEFAKEISKNLPSSKQGIVIGLKGELGGGKTTFTQAFAKTLGVKEKVLSPTFVIFKKFAISPTYAVSHKSDLCKHLCKQNLYHFDCYRIKDSKEILELGFEEIISNPQNIIVIEWADNIKKILPPNTIWINFKFIDTNTRKIMIR